MPFDLDRRAPVSAAERVDGRGANRGDAGQSFDVVEHAPEQLRAWCTGRVGRHGRREFHREQLTRIESERAVLQALKVLQHEAGADQQHDRETGLGDDEGVEQAVTGAAVSAARPPAVLQRLCGVRAGERGDDAGQDACKDRHRQREQQHTAVHAGGAHPQLLADTGRDQGRHELRQPFGQQQSGRTADQGEQDGLREHLPELPPSTGAEGRSNRELLRPADRAGEDQVRHVDAREQQQEADDQEQRQHRAVLMIDQIVSQGDRGDRVAGQRLGVLLFDVERRRGRGPAAIAAP